MKLETAKSKRSLEIFNSIKEETVNIYSLKVINVAKAHRETANKLLSELGLYETGYFEDFVNIESNAYQEGISTPEFLLFNSKRELKRIIPKIPNRIKSIGIKPAYVSITTAESLEEVQELPKKKSLIVIAKNPSM